MQRVPPILHFNTSCIGGAAIAARKIHDSLTFAGIDSRFCFLDGEAPNPSYERLQLHTAFGPFGRVWHGLVRRIRERVGSDPTGQREPFGWSTIPGRRVSDIPPLSRSVVHLHWVNGLVDYRVFFRHLPSSVPIVWTLHDINPLTGGCHYTWGCDGFAEDCSRCPQLKGPAAARVASKNQALRIRAISNQNLHVVANSTWVESQAKRSSVLKTARSFRTIHYGIDLERYQPRDPRSAKQHLGIDEGKKVVAFGSYRLDADRKGFSALCQALTTLDHSARPVLLTFGHEGAARAPDGVEWISLGEVGSTRILSCLYNAADIFAMPSLEEAAGQTAMEALACATPVVAFDVGGVSDFVISGETGLLAAAGDTADLGRNLSTLLRDEDLRAGLGASGRKLMKEGFSLDRQARNYIRLYEDLAASSET